MSEKNICILYANNIGNDERLLRSDSLCNAVLYNKMLVRLHGLVRALVYSVDMFLLVYKINFFFVALCNCDCALYQ